MYYITATLADKLLPIASRGDIEGAVLAILLNILAVGLISFSTVKFIKFLPKALAFINRKYVQ